MGQNRGGPGGARPGAGRKPGVPGKVRQELRDLARSYAPEALKRAVYWMREGDGQVSIRAIEILLDRGHGKATQILEIKRTPFDDMSPDELRAIAEAIEALPGDPGRPAGGNPSPALNGSSRRIPPVH